MSNNAEKLTKFKDIEKDAFQKRTFLQKILSLNKLNESKSHHYKLFWVFIVIVAYFVLFS